jgi:PST family polysaccharide transporter
MRELLCFGRHVMAARLLNVAASKADAFLVGLVLGPLALGFYSVACRMLLALEQLFCQGVDAVALSAFSRAGDDRAHVQQLFLSATRTAAFVALPVFGGIALLADDIVAGVIGAVWSPSAPLLQVLMGAGLIQALTHFNHAVFKACGRPELSLRLAAWSTGLNVATLAVAVHYGITAVALSYLARAALVAPFGVHMACRLLGVPLRSYLGAITAPLIACALALASAAAMTGWMDAALHPLARAGLVAMLGLAVYALALRLILDSRARAAHRAGLAAKTGHLENTR